MTKLTQNNVCEAIHEPKNIKFLKIYFPETFEKNLQNGASQFRILNQKIYQKNFPGNFSAFV